MIRFFRACETSSGAALPAWNRRKIIDEHWAYKMAVGKSDVGNYTYAELCRYMAHMEHFMASLDKSPSTEDIVEAIEFFNRLERLCLWEEFDNDKRRAILDRHQARRDFFVLNTAVLRGDYKALVDHREYMLQFGLPSPPIYEDR